MRNPEPEGAYAAPSELRLSGRFFVPPAFPGCGGELPFGRFGVSGASGVEPAVIAPAAVEQEIEVVEEKHL